MYHTALDSHSQLGGQKSPKQVEKTRCFLSIRSKHYVSAHRLSIIASKRELGAAAVLLPRNRPVPQSPLEAEQSSCMEKD